MLWPRQFVARIALRSPRFDRGLGFVVDEMALKHVVLLSTSLYPCSTLIHHRRYRILATDEIVNLTLPQKKTNCTDRTDWTLYSRKHDISTWGPHLYILVIYTFLYMQPMTFIKPINAGLCAQYGPLILHMLAASVHRTFGNTFKGTMNFVAAPSWAI